MTPERLLENFSRISNSPYAINRLRGLVLNLAIRGKLVAQEPTKVAEAPRSEGPFALPSGWKWHKLVEVLTKLTDGTHHSPPNSNTGEYKYITAKNIKNDGVDLSDVTYVSKEVHDEIFARCNPAKGDILYIKDGATTGVVTINNLAEPFSMLSSVALLKPAAIIFNEYLVHCLRSPFFYEQMRSHMKGAAITRVTLSRMSPTLLPVPPLAEQHRIVAKVDELMALCDQLEAAQQEREARRDRLVTASLKALVEPPQENSEEEKAGKKSRKSAPPSTEAFFLQQIPRLTTHPKHIQQLRQTILDLAVRGRLVRQEGEDELDTTRIDLGENINSKKEQRSEAWHQLPFELPANWEIFLMSQLAEKLGAGSTPLGGKTVYQTNGIPFLRSQNVYNDGLRLGEVAFISPAVHNRMAGTHVRPKDLLLNITGASIGRCAIVPETLKEANVSQHVAIVRLVEPAFGPFVHLSLISPVYQRMIDDVQVGVSREGLSMQRLRKFPMIIPPLAEQHRIVAKVNQLMALCDQLEAQIKAGQETSRKLLEALLHEALEGAGAIAA